MSKKLKKNTLIDLALLLAITGFLLSWFSPEYLFSINITTGGDTGSHYHTAEYLKDYLLPNGRLTGWTQGNYAGYPILQSYFPLPFIIMVLLSFLMPLQVAFKLVTVLGIFLLPICTYLSLRLLRYKFPVPIIGAIFTLSFLFMESNSMWGGNIPSTLAGEFSFSVSLALTVLFIGTLYNGITSGKRAVSNAIIIALIGSSHGYTLLFSGFASLYFLFTTDFSGKLKYLLKVHLLGFLIMGFWIVPMLWYAPYTTRFSMIWKIQSINEVFPVILLPFVVIALAGRVLAILRKAKKTGVTFSPKHVFQSLFGDTYGRINYLWACVLTGALLYLVAYNLNVIDIRFVPFIQILLLIIAGVEVGRMLRLLKLKWLTPLIMFIAVIVWADHNEKNIQNWIKWNYTGFEGKSGWQDFSNTNKYLEGTPSDPRVVYEHSPLHNATGTIRAFETLPFFSGRSTLEGLHMMSSISSPFIFYIESEISKQPACPFPDYDCSVIDLPDAARHLRLFNVRDLIARSDELKNEIRQHPEFILKKSIGPYEIYELTTNENKYVVPLQYEPVLYKTKNWKTVSYRWFKNKNINDVHLVFSDRAADKFKAVMKDGELSNIPKIPVQGTCSVTEKIINEEIQIKTDCIHRPLLIKVSYHPRWRVEGAKKIYLASPSFMLIFPEKEDVRLHFSPSWVEYTGNSMTLFALCIMLLSPVIGRHPVKTRLDLIVRAVGFNMNIRPGRRARIIIISLLVLVPLITGILTRMNNPESTNALGMALYNQKKYNSARYFLNKTITALPNSSIARDASFFYAVTYFVEGNNRKAIDSFQRLINNFPESYWSAEAYYHIGLAHTNLKNRDKAAGAFRFVMANYSSTVWAEFSQDKLSKLSEKKLTAEKHRAEKMRARIIN